MTYLKQLLGGAALVAVLAGQGMAQDSAATPGAGTVVATVNGVEITLGQMIVMRAQLPEQYQALPDDMLFPALLDQLIQQTALATAASAPLSEGAAIAIENQRRSFLAAEEMNRRVEGKVTEEDIAAAYAAQYADAPREQEFNAQHILVETEDEAAAIKAEIDGGADFGELARTRSTGPSGPNGGDLGWFGKGMMVEPFEQAILALQPGEVSGPVQTQFGWHVIRLNEARDLEPPALDAVRDQIEQGLRQAALQEAIDAATAAAEIQRSDEGIDPAIISNFDLVAQ